MGIAELALGAAPIAGGALLGVVAGNLKAPDLRGSIKADLDLLDRLPEDDTARRAELQRVIDLRVDDIIASIDKNRALRSMAASYTGNWRDIVVFLCAILFTIVWWNVNHSRSDWLLMFIVMILVSIAAGIYASRGALRALRTYTRERRKRGAAH